MSDFPGDPAPSSNWLSGEPSLSRLVRADIPIAESASVTGKIARAALAFMGLVALAFVIGFATLRVLAIVLG